SLEHVLRVQLGLYDGGSQWYNWGGKQEKWVPGAGADWYFILPDGSFYRWNLSNTASGPWIAQLPVADYNDPSLLSNAQPGSGNVTLSLVGNQLTIAPVSGYHGTLVVTASVSDGIYTAGQTFQVTVQPSNTLPTLAPIPDQTMAPAPATLTVPLAG